MAISAKGQYAMKIMLDLAIYNTGDCVSIKTIATRQNMPEKYLEQIIPLLTRTGFVKSTRGAKGGYRLAGSPSDYTVGMILKTIEGDLAPVEGLEAGIREGFDSAEDRCLLSLWTELYDAINLVLDRVTLADLVKNYRTHAEFTYMI